MAFKYIKVNTGALKNDAGELETAVKATEKQLTKISDGMEALSKMWTGPANDALMKQYRADNEFLVSLCKQIDNFARDLKNAATEYDRCEDSVMNAVREIKV